MPINLTIFTNNYFLSRSFFPSLTAWPLPPPLFLVETPKVIADMAQFLLPTTLHLPQLLHLSNKLTIHLLLFLDVFTIRLWQSPTSTLTSQLSRMSTKKDPLMTLTLQLPSSSLCMSTTLPTHWTTPSNLAKSC